MKEKETVLLSSLTHLSDVEAAVPQASGSINGLSLAALVALKILCWIDHGIAGLR
ncbi:hypothetical protein LNP26_04860 [Klebsiella variicola subsp. variicola]|nr:hypothetical protein [Klebsiella variicola subsp. variicola]